MYTAGLRIAMKPDRLLAQSAQDQLTTAGPFFLGNPKDHFLPAVLEAPSPCDAQKWHEWACQLEGVSDVDVVFVHWEQPDTELSNDAK